MTRHLILLKSRLMMAAQHYDRNFPNDFLYIYYPLLFLEIFFYIFFLIIVIDCLIQHRCATPSSITIAAIYNPCYSFPSSLSKFTSQLGHYSFMMVNLLSSSIQKVWYCPIFKYSFSLAFLPLMLMHSRSYFAKWLISTISRVSVSVLVRMLLRPEALVQSMIFLLVFMRMWSPLCMRLQMCHRSQSSVGTSVTYPSPHTFLMLFRSILIIKDLIIQQMIILQDYNRVQVDSSE